MTRTPARPDKVVRDITIGVRVAADELEQFRRAATIAGMPVATWMRQIARLVLKEKGR